ncbi:putative ribonuclease H-like domain-containing protein [Tanacetum coccineum]
MVPRTVLSRSGPISVNTVRPVNIVQPRTAVNNAGPMKNLNIVKGTRVNTARLKVVLSAVKRNKGNKGNAVKASACWVWRPKHKILDHVSRKTMVHQCPLKDLTILYHKAIQVSNGLGPPKETKFSYQYVQRQSTAKIIKDKGEDLLPLEELKFNLFSVSQMCDKKNSVLFSDTKCVVLSPNFKLTDESHVLLKVPRKDNMYSVDLKNVVPQGGIENLIDLRVKVIRCDNGIEFKNKVMNQFCEMKGIKREFSVARTP